MKNLRRLSRFLLLKALLFVVAIAVNAGEEAVRPARELDKAIDVLLKDQLQSVVIRDQRVEQLSRLEREGKFQSHPDWPVGNTVSMSLERLREGLRALVNAAEPKPGALSKDTYAHTLAIYRWKVSRYNALLVLSEFRDPQDLPLFWTFISMDPPYNPDWHRMPHWYLEEKLSRPIAKAMAKYGAIARQFIIAQIAKGEANDWIRPKDDGNISGIYHVFGETWATGMAREPEEDLGRAAEIAKPDEKENILKFIALLKVPQPKGKKEE